MPFYAGNTHCHTTNSDGDSAPPVVAEAYRQAGFDFVSITDHNCITDPSECAVTDDKFLVISGSEFSAGLSEPRYRSIHVNGIGMRTEFELREQYTDISSGLAHAVEQIKAQDAFSTLNHPNWKWSWGANEIRQVPEADSFEVWNGGWTCNSAGNAEHPSTDQIWDEVLSAGQCIWGVASDDCHHFSPERRFDPYTDKIATGWIEVWADELSEAAIVAALKAGNFIATTRIKLESLNRSAQEISFTIKEWDEVRFETHFIGKDGKILSTQCGHNPSYHCKGDELYVRAKIFASTGDCAWIQPVFL